MNDKSSPCEVELNTWSKVLPSGTLPEPRVGHTALYYKKDKKVVLIGGATPNSLYNEAWVLHLNSLKYERLDVMGEFTARYEHSAFMPRLDEPLVWVFAGADNDVTKNDLCELNLDSLQWSQLTQSGDVPSERTYHTTSALLDNNFVVFCGGEKNVKAISNVQVYQLDLQSREWKVLSCKGQPPKPRQGHVMVALDDKLLCHGGMSGSELFDDLHILNSDGTWMPVECKQRPSKRAAHGAVLLNKYMYVFGGLGESGALNDVWRLNVDSLEWELVVTAGTKPSCRLDFSLVLVDLPSTFLQEESGSGDEEQHTFMLVHGGLDDTGNIFDDMYALRVA